MRSVGIGSALRAGLYALLAIFVAACGGGSGDSGGTSGDTGSAGGTGSVALAMTDGPTDEFAEINVTMVKVELLSDDGGVTIYEGRKTFNLLDLADKAELFAIRHGVPAKRYSKIRLTLTEIELVKKDAGGKIIETAYPKLPGNGKLDLVPRGDFTVHPGQTLFAQIDMDAKKSIHVVGKGNGKYGFRSVVFVDVLSADLLPKLVRIHGVIQNINGGEGEFDLCETDIPVRLHDDREDDQSPACVLVDVVDGTSIFDAEGRPTGFASLVQGEEATVYGNFRREDRADDSFYSADKDKKGPKRHDNRRDDDRDDDQDDDADDREAEDDGKGDKDRDDDRDQKDKDDPEDYGDETGGDGRYDREIEDLGLVAVVVELGSEGTYERLHGVVQSEVDSEGRFIIDRRFGLDDALEPAPGAAWHFDTDDENWFITGQVDHNPTGTLTVSQDIQNVEYYSPLLEDIQAEFDGALYPYVQVRLHKLSGSITNWEGFLYWATAGHSWSDSYRNDIPLPAALEAGEWVTLTWNMHQPTFGANDWKDNVIVQIRFDLVSNAGPVFEIDSVVVGRRASEVVVQLQDGTKIINRFGATLNVNDIEVGVPLVADGVLDASMNPAVLHAALVVLDTDAGRTSKLSGEIGPNPDGSCGLGLLTDTGDRSIRYGARSGAYIVSDAGSQQVSVSFLPSGLSADAYGMEGADGCFEAETIIVFQ